MGRAAGVDACGKRLAGELQPRGATEPDGGSVPGASVRTASASLRSDKLASGRSSSPEGLRTEQLGRADDTVLRARGLDQQPGHDAGGATASDGRPPAHVLARERACPPPRRRAASLGSDGTRDQLAVLVEHPEHRQSASVASTAAAAITASAARRSSGRREPARGIGERLDGQPLGIDDHRHP